MILPIKKLNQALGDFLFLLFYCYLLNQAQFLLDFELQGLIYTPFIISLKFIFGIF